MKDTISLGLCTTVMYWLGFPILVWGVLLFVCLGWLVADMRNRVVPIPDIIYDTIFREDGLGLNAQTAPYIMLGYFLLIILIWLYS